MRQSADAVARIEAEVAHAAVTKAVLAADYAQQAIPKGVPTSEPEPEA